jgi:hypothetical protein
MNNHISIIQANYIDQYKIEFHFNDGKVVVVDFMSFLQNSSHPEIRKYLDLEKFKSFRIIAGEIDWNDFDLVFPVYDLYSDSIEDSKQKTQAS